MDVSKLSDEDLGLIDKYGIKNEDQLNVANKVKQESIKNGLNPDFVLPMVRHESNFNQSSISKDKEGNPIAYGVMQITPDTAKTYKCDDLKDIDQNISCGVRILSDLISKPNIGNNPYKVLAGYNAGPKTPFVNSGDIADLPLETLNYMDRVSDTYGGDLPNVSIPNPDTAANNMFATPPQIPPLKNELFDPQETLLLGAAGYGAGTATGAAKIPVIGGLKKSYDWATTPLKPQNVEQTVSTQSNKSSTKTHGGENWTKSLTGVDIPNSQMQKSDLDLAKRMSAAVGINGEQGFTGGKITPGGIIVGPQSSATPEPKTITQNIKALAKFGSPEQKTFAQNILSTARKNIPTVTGFGGAGMGIGMSIPQAIKQFQQGNYNGALGTLGAGGALGTVMAAVPRLAPGISSVLGGYDIANRLDKDNMTGAGISALGTLGPLAIMASGLAPPVGVPLALGSAFIPAAINAYRDYRNEKNQPSVMENY